MLSGISPSAIRYMVQDMWLHSIDKKYINKYIFFWLYAHAHDTNKTLNVLSLQQVHVNEDL